jgi:RNA polymerase sigma-70 factor (ECF subfamily)
VDVLAATLKAASPRALATLIRLLQDIDTAEDMAQEAIARALEVWPRDGIPHNPVAWLVTTARNRAVDLHRRHKLELRQLTALSLLEDGINSFRREPADLALPQHVNDDLLRLIFTCCHPALAQEDQVALTLKTIAGLTVSEIARAFLVSTKTMEQRLTRAKRRIREEGVPYEAPSAARLPERLDAVLAVIYLLFNEGYSASGDAELIRVELCNEAIRLARLLARLFRGEAEVTGLLALLLLQHARRRARLDKVGNIIPLDEQNRSLWDQSLIAEGRALVEKALWQKRLGPYQIQAAIAALHDEAKRMEETDWEQIADLYGVLERRQPSPVVTLNRAVAVAKARGPKAGIAVLRMIEDHSDMQRYHHFHAALGALLAEDGEIGAATAAYEKALSLTRNPSEKAFLRKKISRRK